MGSYDRWELIHDVILKRWFPFQWNNFFFPFFLMAIEGCNWLISECNCSPLLFDSLFNNRDFVGKLS